MSSKRTVMYFWPACQPCLLATSCKLVSLHFPLKVTQLYSCGLESWHIHVPLRCQFCTSAIIRSAHRFSSSFLSSLFLFSAIPLSCSFSDFCFVSLLECHHQPFFFTSPMLRFCFSFSGSVPLACLALGLFCLSMLSRQNHHPNRFNAKDMWHKPGISLGRLVPRCSTDLSEISLILPHTVHLVFPLSFCFISMVLDLLTLSPLPLYIVSFHLLHFVTQMTFYYVPDSLFGCSLFLYLPFDFLSVSVSQVHCLISSVLFVLLSFRGQCRAPLLSQGCSLAIMGL